MNEVITDISEEASRWARAKAFWTTLPRRFVEDYPQSFLGAAIALALIGYAVPLLFPIATLALAFGFIAALLEGGSAAVQGQWVTLGLLALCATLTASLWRLRVGDPPGESLTAEQTPALFTLIDEIRSAFQAPVISDIHLSDDTRLTVHRVPRTGYPFLFRHVLVAGMPALQCLTLDQFKCLLAACVGELSAVRTDVAGWITQLARTWRQYRSAVAGRWSPAAVLYRLFLAAYEPLMAALAARLDGAHRLKRDHYALEVASDDLVVDMIVGEVIMQRFLKEIYWPTVMAAAEHSATPNFKVFRNLEAVFRKRVTPDIVQAWVREAFVGKWRDDAGDPGLKARLNEIGHGDVRYHSPESAGAAQALFGASYQWIIDRCDARWAEEHKEEWRNRHEKAQRQYSRLYTLRESLQRGGLRGDEAMEYAALVKRYGTPEEAMKAYERILELNPGDARIKFGVGKFMLSRKDVRGVKLLESAMQMDKRLVDPACRLISGFVVEHKMQDALRSYVSGNPKDRLKTA
ncbi:MAG: hypothetical protein LOY58_02810 [Gammaproteobacteria bacterium]|jgi:tetratricopeptide (TPR) repeat protein|nr:hypothetical protein [Gammaproteobacteria bacterium]